MKKLRLLKATALLTVASSILVYAGTWMNNTTGWWYDNGDGTYPASCWQWIDGNNDGTAECYYFDQNGYLSINTYTPDGYQVDLNGAWIENGVVKTRSFGNTASNNSSKTNIENTKSSNSNKTTGKNSKSDDSDTGTSGFNMWDMDTTDKSVFVKKKNVVTNQKQVWSKAWLFQSVNDILASYTSYAEFYIGGNYTTLTFTAAPNGTTYKKNFILQIYGDDDQELATFDFNRKSKPLTETVDVSGQEYIKFFFTLDTDDLDTGSAGLYLKNVNLS